MGYSTEKALLPAQVPVAEVPKPKSNTKRNVLTFLSLFVLFRAQSFLWGSGSQVDLDAKRGSCAQADAMFPQKYDPSHLVNGNEGKIIDWLSGAVRVPTESELYLRKLWDEADEV
jgi:Gly-Xaa carboxypeptidase